MKIQPNYAQRVRSAAELIRDRAEPGASGHMAVCAGSLDGQPGNTAGPFTLTTDGLRQTAGDLAAALAVHAAWNTRSAAAIWHETPDGRRLVLR